MGGQCSHQCVMKDHYGEVKCEWCGKLLYRCAACGKWKQNAKDLLKHPCKPKVLT